MAKSLKNAVNSHKLFLFEPIATKLVKEQFKTQSETSANKTYTLTSKLLEKLGEPHPFDYKLIEDLRKKFCYVNTVIDKYCDFVLGPGYTIVTEDEEAKEFLDNWHKETKFKTFLKPWFSEGVSKGAGFIEVAGLSKPNMINMVKVPNSNTIYVKRDKFGTVTQINQFLNDSNTLINENDIIELKKDEIIQYNNNEIGNSAYGYGIVWAAMDTIDKFLMAQSAIHKLTKRKANTPVHWKLGDMEKDDWPSQTDIEAFGATLQFMNECTEYVTGPNAEAKVIDYGNIGDKFNAVLENDYKLLSYAFQVPEVIMGSNESSALGEAGKSNVQMDGFNRRIRSLQDEFAQSMRKIFDKVLENNGMLDVEYEIVWNQLSEEENDKKLQLYQTLLSTVSESMKKEIEKKIAEIIGIDWENVEKNEEEMQQKEQDTSDDEFSKQLQLQKQAQKFKMKKKEMFTNITESMKKKVKASYEEKVLHEEVVNENIKVSEWLHTPITNRQNSIIESLALDDFSSLAGSDWEEINRGYLKDVKPIREVFIEAIKNNWTLGQIKEALLKTDIKDLTKKDGTILSREKRIDMIAKTELTRILNQGLLNSYLTNGTDNTIILQWDAVIDESTCPICAGLNGQKFDGDTMTQDMVPPIHANCRCSLEEVTKHENVSLVMKLKEELKNKLAPQEVELLEQNKIDEFIRKNSKGEFCVISHQTGKNFGCYASRGEAEKRLAQIHKFK